ncbi:MAG: CoA pyrophosphatase [Dehalococcoidales bacterium]|nr:CoA pyrophosphatase [Dehalococcoidales bacterium]
MEHALKKLLSRRTKRRLDAPGRRPAAVLVPLYENEGHYHVVLIRRTHTVKTHQGEISFPGGTRDPQDRTLLETALRESHEEIGLRPGDVTVIGELDDELTTTSDFIVTPFVGIIPYPYPFVPNKHEVAEIVEVPLHALGESPHLREDTETLDGRPIPSYTYNYRGNIIWGATARILKKLLDIIASPGEGKPKGT